MAKGQRCDSWQQAETPVMFKTQLLVVQSEAQTALATSNECILEALLPTCAWIFIRNVSGAVEPTRTKVAQVDRSVHPRDVRRWHLAGGMRPPIEANLFAIPLVLLHQPCAVGLPGQPLLGRAPAEPAHERRPEAAFRERHNLDASQDPSVDLWRVGRSERTRASHQLVQEDPEAPPIRSVAVAGVACFHNFWGHVARRPANSIRAVFWPGQTRRHAKVAQLAVPGPIEHHVLHLNVAVDHPLAVQVLQRPQHARHVEAGVPLRAVEAVPDVHGAKVASQSRLHQEEEVLAAVECCDEPDDEWAASPLHRGLL
mmetsp:Transcript_119210/g.297406  ORF Transcript_119210/g.297406 Transcript_119210/m.297406 type:complete len:313 (+) Transcript_119210:16-954(+)